MFDTVPATSQRWWETTVSSTRDGAAWGKVTSAGVIVQDVLKTCPAAGLDKQDSCTNYARTAQDGGDGSLRAASTDDSSWIQIGRQKTTAPGPSYYQESVALYIRVARHGRVVRSDQLLAPRYGTCRDGQRPVRPVTAGSGGRSTMPRPPLAHRRMENNRRGQARKIPP